MADGKELFVLFPSEVETGVVTLEFCLNDFGIKDTSDFNVKKLKADAGIVGWDAAKADESCKGFFFAAWTERC